MKIIHNYRALALAVVVQAIRDAHSETTITDHHTRQEARTWLATRQIISLPIYVHEEEAKYGSYHYETVPFYITDGRDEH